MTVITVSTDRKRIFPSLWQILKRLLCSLLCPSCCRSCCPAGCRSCCPASCRSCCTSCCPASCRSCCCCSDEEPTQTSIAIALGTMQIMVGLFNIGLGPGRTSTSPGDLTSLGAAYWLGAVFIVTGIMSILAGKFPSSCLMGFTVFMNFVGAIFAITGIVLYVLDLGNASVLWMCEHSRNTDLYGDNCRNVALSAQNLLTYMDILLIAMAVLQLLVSIRFAILGIKALTSEMRKEEGGDVEDELPQLKEVLLVSPGDNNQFN